MKDTSTRIQLPWTPLQKRIIYTALLVVATFALVWAFYTFLPAGFGGDWGLSFRPAALNLIKGDTPYHISTGGVLNPPWIIAMLVPLAVLPEKLGWAILCLVNLFAFGFVAYKLGAKPLSLLFLLFSMPFLHLLNQGQIDGLIVLGYILPRPIGLFLILGKPQIGIGVAFFWLIEAYREKKLKGVVLTFLPVTLAYLLSFVIYGPYIFSGTNVVGQFWDYNIWPIGIPIGLIALKYAIQKRKQKYALMSVPFLTPYIGFHSYSAALLGLVDEPLDILLASVGTWIIFFLGG